jgi:hypothetical protein
MLQRLIEKLRPGEKPLQAWTIRKANIFSGWRSESSGWKANWRVLLLGKRGRDLTLGDVT